MINNEKRVEEAVKRLNNLEIESSIVKEFESNDVVTMSEIMGLLFFANEDERELIAKLEERYDIKIYHGIMNNTEIGKMYSFLYVSESEEEWEADLQDTLTPLKMSTVDFNKSTHKNREYYNVYALCGIEGSGMFEFGSIGVAKRIGGLQRIY